MDIHRKPATTRSSCSSIPRSAIPALTVGWKLAKRKLGFRTLLDVIPLDATLVKGSHGRRAGPGDLDAPVFITRRQDLLRSTSLQSTQVHDVILAHLRG